MLIILNYVGEREPSSVIVDREVLRHADLPALAGQLLRSLPSALRVRIYPDWHGQDAPVVDTGDPFIAPDADETTGTTRCSWS
ncbi:hypothetical protein E0504_25335 [Parafrankia sp. BMG5.11]|nr:hypothetical protein E0504_25335 [Parafrankia sp. BMG5.11]